MSREKGPQKSCGGGKFILSFEKTVSKVKNVEGKGKQVYMKKRVDMEWFCKRNRSAADS